MKIQRMKLNEKLNEISSENKSNNFPSLTSSEEKQKEIR